MSGDGRTAFPDEGVCIGPSMFSVCGDDCDLARFCAKGVDVTVGVGFMALLKRSGSDLLRTIRSAGIQAGLGI